MRSYTQIRYGVEDHVATLTFDRPEVLNAMGTTIKTEVHQALVEADADDDVRVVIITGNGRAFCAGADLKERARRREAGDVPLTERAPGAGTPPSRTESIDGTPVGMYARMIRTMQGFHKPLIAAVNGPAVGGGLLFACAADIRVASSNAQFSMVFTRRGLSPEVALSWYLPRLVGLEQAFRLVYTGAMVDAEQALRIGLVSEVVEPDRLMPRVRELAAQIASMPALALGLARKAIIKGLSTDDPEVSLMMEIASLSIVQRGHDYYEGQRAFLEKREPQFEGY